METSEDVAEMDFAGLTAGGAVARLARALTDAGVETPGRDARLLVAAALDATAEALLREPDRMLTAPEAATLADHARRRAAREPVSRILGRRAFYGRDFRIGPATLDPRPSSETLIAAALAIADEEGWRARPIRILDVGTGSGCLLLTLLAELPLASGVGTDISREALAMAAINAGRLGLAERARFEERSGLVGLKETFDLVVSNPPYIPTGDIAALEAEVRAYDPRSALDGGADGLDVYRLLAGGLVGVLAGVPGRGWAVFEVGAGQSDAVGEILLQHAGEGRFEGLRTWKDLAGHTRCVALQTQL